MQKSRHFAQQLLRFGFVLLLSFALGGCTVKLVADYDSVSFEEVLKVGKNVDKFYGHLLEAKSKDRAYPKFSDKYVEIETDIRSVVVK